MSVIVKSGRWAGLRVWSVAGGVGVVLEVGGTVVTVGWVESPDCVSDGCCVSCGGSSCGGSGCAPGSWRGGLGVKVEVKVVRQVRE